MEDMQVIEKSLVEIVKTQGLYYVRVYDPEADRYVVRMTGKTCKVQGNFVISFQRSLDVGGKQVLVRNVLFVNPENGKTHLFENIAEEIVVRFCTSGLCFCRLYEEDWYFWNGEEKPLTRLGRFDGSLAFLVFVGRDGEENYLTLLSDEAFERVPYARWERFYDETQGIETVRILKPNGEKLFVQVRRNGRKAQILLRKYEGEFGK